MPSPPHSRCPAWVPSAAPASPNRVVAPGVAVDLVDAVVAVHDVVIDAAAQHVVAGSSGHLVLAGAAVAVVVACAAIEPIGVAAAEQEVVAAAAAHGVLAVAGLAGEREALDRLRCDERRQDRPLDRLGEEVRRQLELVCQGFAGRQAELLARDQLRAAPQHVAAGIAGERCRRRPRPRRRRRRRRRRARRRLLRRRSRRCRPHRRRSRRRCRP